MPYDPITPISKEETRVDPSQRIAALRDRKQREQDAPPERKAPPRKPKREGFTTDEDGQAHVDLLA